MNKLKSIIENYRKERQSNNDVILDKDNNKIIMICKGKRTEFDIKKSNTLFVGVKVGNPRKGMVFSCYEDNHILEEVKCIFKDKKKIAYLRNLQSEIIDYKSLLLKQEYEEKIKTIENIVNGKSCKKKENEDDIISITHPNGKIEYVSTHFILSNKDYVLVAEGGSTYHKCTGCFKKWSSAYQENFSGWNLISLKDAKSLNLELCNFCKEVINLSDYDEDDEDF